MESQEVKRIIEVTNEFLTVPSSISFEKPFLNYLKERIEKLGYKTLLNDRYLVVKPKSLERGKHLFSAHVDRHAVIKNEDDVLEYLAFYLKKKNNFPFKREKIEKDEKKFVERINSMQTEYTFELSERYLHVMAMGFKSDLKFEKPDTQEFYEKIALRYVGENITSYNPKSGKSENTYKIRRFDINHKEKLSAFDIGDSLEDEDMIFKMESQVDICKNYFYGQIDNVISVAVLFYLLESFDIEDEIIFTTQEEIGKSYECVIDYLGKIDYHPKLTVIDTSPYENFEDYEDGFLVLRKGDETAQFDVDLTKKIESFVEQHKIPHTFKSSKIGLTELGRIVEHTKGKVNGTTIQLPSKNYHTTYETSTALCLLNYYKIIRDLIEKKKD